MAPNRPVTRRALFLREVYAQIGAMRSTRYQHTTVVDCESGAYFLDCSGLIEYVLARSVPEALRALPTSTKPRPLAVDIAWHLLRAPTVPADPWLGVRTAPELQPGDLVAWVTPRESRSRNTGHVMVVTAAPTPNPCRAEEWLVEIVDSTSTPHARDSRRDGSTGLGSGVIGLVVDIEGRPTGYRWRGGESPKARRTLVALGRLREERDAPEMGTATQPGTQAPEPGVKPRCWARWPAAPRARSGPVGEVTVRAW